MRQARLLMFIVTSIVLASAAASAATLALSHANALTHDQDEGPGCGDDLARIQQWRSFLDRAHRAFTAAKMSTTEIKAKITEADERITEIQAARKGSKSEKAGRSDITGDVAFLERALRAFTAAKMSTTDVNRWLAEAKEAAGGG